MERLTRLHPDRRSPAWFAELAHGGPEVLDGVATAAESYVEACLTPHWTQIRAHVDRDRMRRACLLAEHGWAAVFESLHPSARWQYPVLELDYPIDHEVRLDGRGLLLQPSFFCQHAPTTLAAPELPPVLAYPIEHEPGWATPAVRDVSGARHLVAVLGRTRANLLHVVAEAPGTTTNVGRRARVPPPTASRQLAALREAGLTASHRNGNQVLHTATPLGLALLNQLAAE